MTAVTGREDPGKLRIGLLLDSFEVPAWVYEMLVTLRQSTYADIALIVVNDSPKPKHRSLFSRVLGAWDNLFFAAYWKLDAKLFAVTPDAFEPRDATALLHDVPVMRVRPECTKYSDRLADADIERIATYHLDVFVRLGFRILRGRILTVAKHGVWSYHHGDNQVNRGGPPGFWEVLEGHAVTGSILQVLTEDLDNGVVLYRSFSATDPVSVKRNRNNYYWKSLSFLPRKLKELHAIGGAEFTRRVSSSNHPQLYAHRLYVTPRNAECAVVLTRHLVRWARRRLERALLREQWIVMFDMRDGVSGSPWRFKRMTPPRDRFWADPHVIYKHGRYCVFIEEFVYTRGKAHISVIEIDTNGTYSAPVPVLERPYHLSYPFVFEWNGDCYMVPESSANSSIEVYRCVEFPHKWELCVTLMQDVTAVDATLFCDGRKWWLFANVRERPGASKWDELFLFSADTPLSTHWTPHPANPVVSDVRRSRPAGAIFEHGGRLYRPSQNSGTRYGYGLNLNRIITLSETEYREEESSTLEPKWARDVRGIHTLSHVNRLTVVDALVQRIL